MKDVDPQRQQLAAAVGRIPSGLFVLTARQGEAETGMLASWVQQCSLDPPQVSVAIKHDRPVGAWLTAGSMFVLNILDDSATDMVVHFGRGFALDQPAFDGLDIEHEHGSAPILTDALAVLHCRVVARHLAGDHDLFVAQVIAGRMLNEGHPMVHVRKSGFHY